MNSVDKVSSMPIFKLLQGFKLQQYAKALFELGYGYEIYKFTFLSENAKANLINKLNLMPGHRARFLNFFEFWKRSYPKDHKARSIKKLK